VTRDDRVDLFPLRAMAEAETALAEELKPAPAPEVEAARAELAEAMTGLQAAREAYLFARAQIASEGRDEVELEEESERHEARGRELRAETLRTRRELNAARERAQKAAHARCAAHDAFLRDFRVTVEPVVKSRQAALAAAVEQLKKADAKACAYLAAHDLMTKGAKAILGLKLELVSERDLGDRIERSYLPDSDTTAHELKRALDAIGELHVGPPPAATTAALFGRPTG
jgi:hypothetical protein